MDEWINYLKNTNEDVFEIIKNLIKIAAIDHPNEFREKRDKLAEENCKRFFDAILVTQVLLCVLGLNPISPDMQGNGRGQVPSQG
ncbi:hypothetical protein Tco_1207086 [Tanacetum coccineum]